MKREGQRYQYQKEFEQDIISVYQRLKREHLMRYGRISRIALLQAVVNSPAKRFYTSEEQASRVIRGMFKGELYPKMKPLTKEMYLEIFARAKQYIRTHPDECIQYVVEKIVQQQAPKFYLTPRSLEQKLCEMKTGRRTAKNSKKNTDRKDTTK